MHGICIGARRHGRSNCHSSDFPSHGEVIARALSLPVPGPVIGIAFLAFIFLIRPEVSEYLSPLAKAILANLSLLFVPAGVGVVGNLDILSENWLAFTVILTGIIGAIVVTPMMDAMRIHDWRARALAAGIASHGIGTAGAFQVNEVAGVFPGIGMALNAVVTSIWFRSSSFCFSRRMSA